MSLNRIQRSFLALVVCLVVSATTFGQAIMTTTGRGNQILFFPTPDVGLPDPTVQVVSGLPSNAVPHGITCQQVGKCLVADGGNFRIFNIDTTQAVLHKTEDTSEIGYDGWGTIAAGLIGPKGAAVILAASDHDSNLYVFDTSTDNVQESTLALSGTVDRHQTDAIVFDANGRAFVHCVKATAPKIGAETEAALNVPSTSMAIDVFDPPYTSKAFTMTAPVEDLSGALTISSDGQTLLATDGIDGAVVIFEAPFSASTVPVVRPAPSGTHAFSGIVAIPGSGDKTVLVVDSAIPFSEFFKPPYGTSEASVQTLPPSVTEFSTGAESVTVSAALGDGYQVGIGTGEVPGSAAGQPAVFVLKSGGPPVAYGVTIPGGGRGQGCARFALTSPSSGCGRGCTIPIAPPPDADVTGGNGRITTPD